MKLRAHFLRLLSTVPHVITLKKLENTWHFNNRNKSELKLKTLKHLAAF